MIRSNDSIDYRLFIKPFYCTSPFLMKKKKMCIIFELYLPFYTIYHFFPHRHHFRFRLHILIFISFFVFYETPLQTTFFLRGHYTHTFFPHFHSINRWKRSMLCKVTLPNNGQPPFQISFLEFLHRVCSTYELVRLMLFKGLWKWLFLIYFFSVFN